MNIDWFNNTIIQFGLSYLSINIFSILNKTKQAMKKKKKNKKKKKKKKKKEINNK